MIVDTGNKNVELLCDNEVEGCSNTFQALGSFARTSGNQTRIQAGVQGRQVRPLTGPGSRVAPDFCPNCKPKDEPSEDGS